MGQTINMFGLADHMVCDSIFTLVPWKQPQTICKWMAMATVQWNFIYKTRQPARFGPWLWFTDPQPRSFLQLHPALRFWDRFVAVLLSRRVWLSDLSKAFAPSSLCGSTVNVTQIIVSSPSGTHSNQPSVAASSSHFAHSLSAGENQLSLNLIILLGT